MRRVLVQPSVWLAILASLVSVACPLDERQMLLVDEGAAGFAGELDGDDGGGSGGSRGGRGGQGNSSGTGDGGDPGGGGDGNPGTGGTPMAGAAGNGAPGGASGSAGSGGSGGSAGLSGSGGVGATAACPDLDLNGEPDCEETLVMNAAFNDDATGWRTETEVDQAWETDDARAVAESGSIAVTNRAYYPKSSGTGMGGTEQCVPVTGGTSYVAVAEMFIDPKQGDGVSAGLSLLFFESTDCSGTSEFSPSSLAQGTGAWLTVVLGTAAPMGVRSAKLRLVAVKPFRLSTFRANFDNVLLRSN